MAPRSRFESARQALLPSAPAEFDPLDYEALSAELLRALRGKRSQSAFSKRLGYRSNAVRTWESGRRFPTAARLLRAARVVGIEPRRALLRFGDVAALQADAAHDPTTASGVVALLTELRGNQKLLDIAARAGRSRYAVSRWLSGGAEPRVPDFLRLVEACTLRVLDFVACLIDPSELPSVASAWARLQAARAVAVERPWSHAVLRALEVSRYRTLRAHTPGVIAAQLGITREEEQECLALLEQSGQVRFRRGKYVPERALTVDTRAHPKAGRSLARFWAEVGVQRLTRELSRAPGDESNALFSYNLFTVSEHDLERLRALHRSYFRELRAIVAQSEPAERVVVANVQLFGLEA